MVITAPAGRFTGYTENGSVWFKGIRYAQAERFRPPVPVTGLAQDCRAFGPKSIQNPRDWSGNPLPGPFDEDCLYLNIVRPAEIPDGPLPVAVDIHGGAFQTGSGEDSALFPLVAEEKARMVAVSINYRLGALGYLYLRDILGEGYCDGNMGLLDQICALKWVKENIAAFGGDPERVTLFGVSAGGKSVGALMLAGETKGLFHRAILSSGGIQAVRTPGTASALARKFCTYLPLRSAKDLLTIPASEILNAQLQFTAGPGSTCLFGPVSDGKTVPENWRADIRSADGWQGETLIGNNLHELVFFKMGPGLPEKAPAIAAELFGGNSAYAERAYHALVDGKGLDTAGQEDAWVKVFSDCMYRTHGDRLSQIFAGRGMKTYTYSFDYPPAHHSQDAATLRAGGSAPSPAGERAPEEKAALDRLMRGMRASYIAFIRAGDPNNGLVPRWEPVRPGSYGRMHFGPEIYFDCPDTCPSIQDFPDDSIDLR